MQQHLKVQLGTFLHILVGLSESQAAGQGVGRGYGANGGGELGQWQLKWWLQQLVEEPE